MLTVIRQSNKDKNHLLDFLMTMVLSNQTLKEDVSSIVSLTIAHCVIEKETYATFIDTKRDKNKLRNSSIFLLQCHCFF